MATIRINHDNKIAEIKALQAYFYDRYNFDLRLTEARDIIERAQKLQAEENYIYEAAEIIRKGLLRNNPDAYHFDVDVVAAMDKIRSIIAG